MKGTRISHAEKRTAVHVLGAHGSLSLFGLSLSPSPLSLSLALYVSVWCVRFCVCVCVSVCGVSVSALCLCLCLCVCVVCFTDEGVLVSAEQSEESRLIGAYMNGVFREPVRFSLSLSSLCLALSLALSCSLFSCY